MAKDNMGIADAEFTSGVSVLSGYGQQLDNQIQEYLTAVRFLCEEAIQDQLIRAKLVSLCEQVESVRAPMKEAVSQAVKDCKAFLNAVDEADQFLY